MSGTVIVQSFHSRPWPGPIEICVDSVQAWAARHGHRYVLVGDEIADRLPPLYRERCFGRWPVMTDLGRLLLLREQLRAGAQRAVWIDADVLIFAPGLFDVETVADHAVGREVWVARDAKGRWKTRQHAHNAVLVFTAASPALDFLIHATRRVVERLERPASPQIAGPKLLTTLHNLVGFPVLESAGMVSPPVLTDLVAGEGPALKRHRAGLSTPMASANLCHSLLGTVVDGVAVDATFLSDGAAALSANFGATGLPPLVCPAE
jgi:hypothetical protein